MPPEPFFDVCSLHKAIKWYPLDCHELYGELDDPDHCLHGQLFIREWGLNGDGWYVTSDRRPIHFFVDTHHNDGEAPHCFGERIVVVNQLGTKIYQRGTPASDPLRTWFSRPANMARKYWTNEAQFFKDAEEIECEDGNMPSLSWDVDAGQWFVDYDAEPPPRWPWVDGVPQ